MAENVAADKSAPAESASTPPPIFSEMVTVNGDIFPKLPVKIPVADQVNNLRKMPMREDDIVIAAFPKCGTHWIWEVIHMLNAGKAEHSIDSKEQMMLEFNEVEKYESMPSPRLLNSHLFLRQLSENLVTKKSRVIHVIRNPKDVAVSFYFHMIQMKGVEDTGALDFARLFLQGGPSPGCFFDYFAYLPEMRKWQREHPDVPFIEIYYEDVKKEPVKCVETLARFLQIDASKELCEAIAEQCSFKKLKHADETIKDKDTPDKLLFTAGFSKLFRKGEVGDWKNYFTVALSEQYDREVPEKLKGCDFNFQYTI